MSVDMILESSSKRQSIDNITSVLLTFEGFRKNFKTKRISQRDDSQEKKMQME
jgi:hypothetical protein